MTQRDKRRVQGWTIGFVVCMWAVVGLARYIRPGGWAIWVAVPVLVAAIGCWVMVARVMREVSRRWDR